MQISDYGRPFEAKGYQIPPANGKKPRFEVSVQHIDGHVVTLQIVGELTHEDIPSLEKLLDDNCHITGLNLSNCMMGDDALKQLLPKIQLLKNLTDLNLRLNHLGPRAIDGLVMLFPQWSHQLVSLELGLNDGMGAEGMKLLAAALPSLQALEILDLRRCSLYDEGLKSVSAVLPECTRLRQVDVGLNHGTYHAAIHFAKAISSLKGLTFLDYSGNEVRSKGALELAQAIKKHQTLQTLNLHTCKLGRKGAASIGEALMHHTALTSINVDDNNIGSEGMRSLARGLQHHKGLHTFSAAGNRIGYEGAVAVAELFHALKALQDVNLSDNNIDDHAILHLASAFAGQKDLIRCELAENSIDTKGAEKLIQIFKELEKFTHLDLSGNEILSLPASTKLHWKLKL